MKNAFEYSERPRLYHDHGNLTVNVMKLESTETFGLVFCTYCTLGRKFINPHEKWFSWENDTKFSGFLRNVNGRVVMKAFQLIVNR